MGMCVVAYSL